MGWIPEGVSDHGALTGLGDDDHTHYLNEARHDALDHSGLTGVGAAGVVVHGATPQSDGSLRFEYGVDSSGRPTYTAAGTAETPAVIVLEDGRFIAREVTF